MGPIIPGWQPELDSRFYFNPRAVKIGLSGKVRGKASARRQMTGTEIEA